MFTPAYNWTPSVGDCAVAEFTATHKESAAAASRILVVFMFWVLSRGTSKQLSHNRLDQFGLHQNNCQAARMNYSPRYGRFRALLRKIREEAGLNQIALAEKLRKPQTFVSKSELGERRLDFLETLDFCEACGVSVTEFFQRLEKGAPMQPEKKKPRRKSPRKMDNEGRLTRP